MQDILIVIDMQNDFVDGALGTKEALAIVPKVVKRVRNFLGRVLFTRDTHEADYLQTQEGQILPVEHCIKGTRGWEICSQLSIFPTEEPIDKSGFGSINLGQLLESAHGFEPISSITLVGLCTDICVISNALLIKAFLPDVPIIVDAACCAGVTPERHKTALEAMKACQIEVINE